MFSENSKKRSRGRPRGPTAQSAATRARLYATAVRLFAERGYEATTLRAIAHEAEVSPGLLYRYFPSKVAVVAELYDQLTGAFVERASSLGDGFWYARGLAAIRLSLEVLRPHRQTLRAVLGPMLTDSDVGLLSEAARDTRGAVQKVFVDAVCEAGTAPGGDLGPAVGRLMDLAQLGAILFWLLDRSQHQQATTRLLDWAEGLSGAARGALWLPGVGPVLLRLDALIADAFEPTTAPPD